MDQLFVKSPYAHIFRKNGKICLYHSINMQTVYGGKFIEEVFNQFTLPTSTNDAINKLSNNPDKADLIIDSLIDTGLLRLYGEEKEDEVICDLQNRAQQSHIRFLYLVPTYECNLRCKYCHVMDNMVTSTKLKMDFHTAKEAIDLFIKYCSLNESTKEVIFYGGEPFINPRIVQFAVTYIRNHEELFNGKVRITTFTNGTRISEEMAEFLANNDVFVIVSLDGPKNINDLMRVTRTNTGSFKKAEKGYFQCQKKGCELGISLVTGKHNVDNLTDCVQYLLRKFKPLDFGLSTLHLFSNGSNPAQIPVNELTQNIIEVYEFARNEGIYVEHLFRRIRPFVEKDVRLKDCPSCGGKLLVTPDRKIGFCEAFMGSDRYFYDLPSFDLTDNDGYAQWKAVAPILRKNCLRCPAIGICGGGCPYDAYILYGDINALDTIRCDQSLILLKWLIWDLFGQMDKSINKKWDIAIPTYEDRQKIYSEIKVKSPRLPLRGYSKYGEL